MLTGALRKINCGRYNSRAEQIVLPAAYSRIPGIHYGLLREGEYRLDDMENDCDLIILHMDATFGGATHDSFIFNNTVIQHHLEQINNAGETAYLLGDSAYEQRSYLMTPCANPEPGPPEEHYKPLHSTARNSVERTIGILKGR